MSNTVTINSKIKIKIDGKVQTLQIVGSADVDPKAGKISYVSPIGEAVLRKVKNDCFIIELPNGKKVEGQVIEIKN